MKNQVIMRKITVIWVDAKSGASAQERKVVLILAAILSAGLVLTVILHLLEMKP